MYSFLY